MKLRDLEDRLVDLSKKDHIDRLGAKIEKALDRDIKVPGVISNLFNRVLPNAQRKEKKAS